MAQASGKPGKIGMIRQMMSALADRVRIAGLLGNTFGDKRNVSEALGYLEKITAKEYRNRYDRGEVASAIVERLPSASWTGRIEVLESDKPTSSDFEKQAAALAARLGLWTEFGRADVLAGLSRYSVILIGAPGDPKTPMQKLKAQTDIAYVKLYGESEAAVTEWDENPESPRYAQPQAYALTTSAANRSGIRSLPVHFSRVVHVPSKVLDDKVYGQPVLEKVWNRIDDLDKVVGAGAEAFWQKVQPGMHFAADKDVEITPAEQQIFEEHIDDFMHGLRRYTLTRGLDVNTPDATVANFAGQADAILTLIAVGTGIPKRILLGSERGELASSQDRDTFNDLIRTRREQRNEPTILRPFFDRIIAAGALPPPAGGTYFVRWPRTDALTILEKSEVAKNIADANSRRKTIVTENELRDQVFGLDPLEEDQLGTDAIDSRTQPLPTAAADREPWQAVGDAAESKQARVRRVVEQAVKRAIDAVDLDELEHAIADGDTAAAEQLLVDAVASSSEKFESAMADALTDTLTAGGRAAEELAP